MSNVVVRKKERLVNGKTIHGGRGKEIDVLSTRGDGRNYYWVEVSVSLSPYLPKREGRMKLLISNAIKKFAKEKESYIHKEFRPKNLHKWFIYSPKIFVKKYSDEEAYIKALGKRGIEAVSFADVLRGISEDMDYMGYDTPRQYIFLFKKMGYKKS